MNATTGPIKDGASFVEAQVYLMPTTAKNVQFKRKIETDVQKLLTQDLQKQTYSMKERNMVSKKGSEG